ncbi:MAG: hypothetical protein ABSD88_13200 [Candidatus Korobacteraceae bacterium]
MSIATRLGTHQATVFHPSNPKPGLPGTPVFHPSNPKSGLPGTPA